MGPEPDLLLEGDGVGKRYGGVEALADVSIRLHRGEILGLVGPNGAGKTTLVDVISGTQHADSGHLRIQGRRLSGPASRRAALGLARTFQYPQLALELTVAENLMVGAVAHRHRSVAGMLASAARGAFWTADRSDRAAIESIAEELQVDRLDRLARELTLGEQRLLEVGRALAQDPVVLLLDEPFAGADRNSVAGIVEVIHLVQQRGHGIILVDHNVDLVSALAQRMMLLDRGRVVFDGAPAACTASPEMKRVYFGAGDLDHAV